MTSTRNYDVVIMGASLAGSCLARQLKLQFPALRIANIDKRTQFDYWVGESTLPPWDDYARRVLRLGRYLDAKHISKHGLRFFFDSPDRDLSMEALSEIGRSRYVPLMPARQLNRAVFDRDLVDMNRELGVDVFLGTTVLGTARDRSEYLHIDGERGHTVHTDQGAFVCRWLVDASGREGVLTRMLDLIEPDTRLDVASYWARFENARCLDDLGSSAWQKRVDYHSRAASTNHFMYRDYWIWLIPVSHNVDSIGVTMRRGKLPPIKNAEGLIAFLREHRCMRELLGESFEVRDFYGLARLTYCASKFFSTDRWFVTGMAGWALDPMRSLICRSITASNQFIGHLIRADLEGRTRDFEAMTRHFDYAMIATYENFIELLRTYDIHDCYDMYAPYYCATLANAINHGFPLAHNDFRAVRDKAIAHGPDCDCTRQATIDKSCSLNRAYKRIARELTAFLDVRGLRHENNGGCFADTYYVLNEKNRPGLWEKLLDDPDPERIALEDQASWETIFSGYIRRMAELEAIPCGEDDVRRVIEPWKSGQTLADGLARLRERVQPPTSMALSFAPAAG